MLAPRIGICSLALFCSASLAARLSCGVKSESIGPTYVELDTATMTARMLYPGLYGILDGRVTLVSKSGNGTDAYNFAFRNLKTRLQVQELEFVLHRNTGTWILFGAGYITANGARHLISTEGTHAASCTIE